MEIKRDLYLEKLIARKHNTLVKVITGIRRCGKSYLLNRLFKQHLLDEGVPADHILEIAFDVRENRALRDPDVFCEYVKTLVKDDWMHYLLLDEIQLLGDFEAVLNGLMRQGNVDLYVTGSNARFLAKDVITEFRGRGDQVHVYPLSFAEFFSATSGTEREAWREYWQFGGLPLILSRPTEETKAAYLKSILEETYLSDIVGRNQIRHPEELGELLDVLASSVGSYTNPTRLFHVFESRKRSTISKNTLVKYVDCLCDSFLLESAKRYDVKGNRYINTPLKYYFTDIGLRNARLNFRQQEETHLLENILFNELKRQGYDVDVGMVEVRDRDVNGSSRRIPLEVDFVCNRGHERIYVQSALQIPDREKMLQEQRSLLAIGDAFKKVILVKDSLGTYHTPEGVHVINVMDFLLHRVGLEG